MRPASAPASARQARNPYKTGLPRSLSVARNDVNFAFVPPFLVRLNQAENVKKP